MLSAPAIIRAKRDGFELTENEIRWLVDGYTQGHLPDYQLSAFAMAVYFKGMTPKETAALTLAMRDSGDVVDLSDISNAKIDKHSTGGVGDKVSICLAPIVAACGVTVPMISGRGLGHTGGTLDKLEAIPGFSVNQSVDTFRQQLKAVGTSLIGQTERLAPADKRLYALRDVTSTVESIPLITASILSKKLAEGIDGLVLDVKVGKGAFMKTPKDALALAQSIVQVGRAANKRVTAVLTDMNTPMGLAIGNALETQEAFEVLHGRGPADLVQCTKVLALEMLRLAHGVSNNRRKFSVKDAQAQIAHVIETGSAAKKMRDIVQAQGGNPLIVDDPLLFPAATHRRVEVAMKSGFVHALDAMSFGLAAGLLGAGRAKVDDQVDPSAGILLYKKPGDQVRAGEPIWMLLSNEPAMFELANAQLKSAVKIAAGKPPAVPLILKIIR